jgi:hypothetical protein
LRGRKKACRKGEGEGEGELDLFSNSFVCLLLVSDASKRAALAWWRDSWS